MPNIIIEIASEYFNFNLKSINLQHMYEYDVRVYYALECR